jgi:hypothetical protein
MKIMVFLAIFGNVSLILWILYNGISEGFVGTALEKISYIFLMLLLAFNSILLIGKVKE